MAAKRRKKRYTLPQLKKYDINQKVIEALADAESRTIMFSIIKKSNTAAGLSQRLGIPLSTVYKKLSELEVLTLIGADTKHVSGKGRRYRTYQSRIKGAEILIKKPDPVLRLDPNN